MVRDDPLFLTTENIDMILCTHVKIAVTELSKFEKYSCSPSTIVEYPQNKLILCEHLLIYHVLLPTVHQKITVQRPVPTLLQSW